MASIYNQVSSTVDPASSLLKALVEANHYAAMARECDWDVRFDVSDDGQITVSVGRLEWPVFDEAA